MRGLLAAYAAAATRELAKGPACDAGNADAKCGGGGGGGHGCRGAAGDLSTYVHWNDLHYVRNLVDANEDFELMVGAGSSSNSHELCVQQRGTSVQCSRKQLDACNDMLSPFHVHVPNITGAVLEEGPGVARAQPRRLPLLADVPAGRDGEEAAADWQSRFAVPPQPPGGMLAGILTHRNSSTPDLLTRSQVEQKFAAADASRSTTPTDAPPLPGVINATAPCPPLKHVGAARLQPGDVTCACLDGLFGCVVLCVPHT